MFRRAPFRRSLLLYLIYGLLFGTALFIIRTYAQDTTTDLLKKWVPWTLRINFFLILVGMILCYRDIFGTLQIFLNKKGMLLVGLVLLALFVTCFVAPRTHRIFYDEDIYLNAAQTIALTNQAGFCGYGTFEYDQYCPHWLSYNKEPSGWPFLMSLAFQIFGVDETYGSLLNNVLLAGSILVVFFIAWFLDGTFFTAFMAALIFALIPHNLTWFNTAAAEPSASFFAGSTVLCWVVYFRSERDRHLFLFTVVLAFSSQTRPESGLVGVWAALAILFLRPRLLLDGKVWAIALPAAVLLLPHALHLWAVGDSSWGADDAKFSLSFVKNNLAVNGLYYFKNEDLPTLFTLFSLTGLVLVRQSLQWKLLLLSWFLLFWGIFLFFYAGSYRYGADVRFALLSFMPLAIFAGMGTGFLRNQLARVLPAPVDSSVILVMIALSWLQFLPLVREVGQEAWGARYDHLHALEFMKLMPRRSIVLTHTPTLFLLHNQNAIQTYAGINNLGTMNQLMEKYKGQVYFHYNYWCNAKGDKSRKLCQEIRDRYCTKEMARGEEQDFEYILYKLSRKEKNTGECMDERSGAP